MFEKSAELYREYHNNSQIFLLFSVHVATCCVLKQLLTEKITLFLNAAACHHTNKERGELDSPSELPNSLAI